MFLIKTVMRFKGTPQESLEFVRVATLSPLGDKNIAVSLSKRYALRFWVVFVAAEVRTGGGQRPLRYVCSEAAWRSAPELLAQWHIININNKY